MSSHSVEASWSILRGENNGQPMFVRLNTGARAVAGSAAYGIRVGVAIPLRNPRADGLPDKVEGEQLQSIVNIPPSDAVTARIRAKVAELEQFAPRLMSCRVMVEARHRHHRKGRLYHVRVDLGVPVSRPSKH